MKTQHIIIAACALVLSPITTQAQAPAAPAAVGQDPTLTALIAKYGADVAATNAARDAALLLVKKPYLTALDAAEAKVSAAGNTAGLKAVVEEKQAVTASEALAPQPSSALPRDVATTRSTYLRETARLGQSTAPRLIQLQGEYLRNLAALELKARAQKNQPFVDQIVGEKLKLAGQTIITAKGASAPKGKNVVVNGDFSQVDAEGKPVGWKLIPPSVLATENGNGFLSTTSLGGYPEGAKQKIEVPPGAKSLTFRCRFRVPEWTPDKKSDGSIRGDGWTGFKVCLYDADGKRIGVNGNESKEGVTQASAHSPIKGWKNIKETVNLPASGKWLSLFPMAQIGKGTVDVDDIEVEFK